MQQKHLMSLSPSQTPYIHNYRMLKQAQAVAALQMPAWNKPGNVPIKKEGAG
jgi:hypothetical protein